MDETTIFNLWAYIEILVLVPTPFSKIKYNIIKKKNFQTPRLNKQNLIFA